MSTLIGSLVKLSTTVDVEGEPTDPTSITLTVQAPDGTLTTQVPIHDGTGLYHAFVTPTMAGIYAYRWTSTGSAQAVDEGTFPVAPSVIGTSPALVRPTPETLATYLDLDEEELDIDRATLMLWQAQVLCESVVSPLPVAAIVVILAAAARAYTNVLGNAQESMGGFSVALPRGQKATSVFLTADERAQLKRLAGRGGAFTVNPLPTDYQLPVPYWDRDHGYGAPQYLGDYEFWDLL